MALPEVITIVPPGRQIRAAITVPGSKSITNRAMVLAALSAGETVLKGALWSEDTQAMVQCLQRLGFELEVLSEPEESCNRTIRIRGRGGVLPVAGNQDSPLELFVGNAGTAARFLSALVCLGRGYYRLHGVPRMHQRPQASLFKALRQLGYEVTAPNDKLPATIRGTGPQAQKCSVSIRESSQFASALLLCAQAGKWEVEIEDHNPEESPYVQMTTEMIQSFPRAGGMFEIEPDASSGSYFLAADMLLSPAASRSSGAISVLNWPTSGWQVDARFADVLRPERGFQLRANPAAPINGGGSQAGCIISRERDLGDSIMTAIVLAPFAASPTSFTDLGRLRLQECERVFALRTELARCGARVIEDGDSLTVYPSQLKRAEVDTYGDHRMAMCFAVVSLAVPGLLIRNPSCVKKTFPDFFQKIAAAPPHGLGAVVKAAPGGNNLTGEDLFAH